MSRFLFDPPRDEDRRELPLHESDGPVLLGDYIETPNEETTAAVMEAVDALGRDPNLDLVGYTFPGEIRGERHELTVIGTTQFSPLYVSCESAEGLRTCRAAGLLRAHRDLALSS